VQGGWDNNRGDNVGGNWNQGGGGYGRPQSAGGYSGGGGGGGGYQGGRVIIKNECFGFLGLNLISFSFINGYVL